MAFSGTCAQFVPPGRSTYVPSARISAGDVRIGVSFSSAKYHPAGYVIV